MEQLGHFDRLCVLCLDHKRQPGQRIDQPSFETLTCFDVNLPRKHQVDPIFDEPIEERLIDVDGARIQPVIVAPSICAEARTSPMLKKTMGTFGRRLPIESRSDEKNPFWSIAVKPFFRSSSGLQGPGEK